MQKLVTVALGGCLSLAACGCGSVADLSGPSQPAALDASAGGTGGDGGSAGDEQDATGGDASGDPDSASTVDVQQGPTAAEACAHFGQVLCGRLEDCAPLLMDIWYGEVSTCNGVLSNACVESLSLPDTAKTPAWTDDCAVALAAWSCEDLLARNTPTACLPPPGPRPDGAPCGEDGQCASAYCQSRLDETCGTCTPRSPVDGPCTTNDDCAPGLACGPMATCVAYAAQGAPCDAQHPCSPWLSCTRVGLNEATCQPAAAGGQMCDANQPGQHPGCNLADGYFCNAATHTCQEFDRASGGDPCGVVGTGYAVCTSASVCKGSGMSGTCLAASGVGGPCDTTNGPFCETGLKCASGTCVDPELATCN